MRLLISAYACAPGLGSDHAVGWNWTTEAHRQGHEVWALASSVHRKAVEKACRDDPALHGIHWVFPEIRAWPLRSGTEPKWERTYNLLWQRGALRHARELQQKVNFDVIHHLTWVGIRAPTFLGSLGPPLIIGPVGGGETSPRSLRDGFHLKARVTEEIRDLSNATITINPLVRKGLIEASVIFASTSDTRDLLARTLRQRILIFALVAIPDLPRIRPARLPRRGPPRLLYAGRLLYWKGVHIAIEAFARLHQRLAGARFTIVGDGAERDRLHAIAASRKIRDHVDFIPRLPQDKLFELYDSHDLLLFPSLHDSGGFVVLEALSHGLPVVCLDLGGPKDIVTPTSGAIVNTKGRNTAEVAEAVADEIFRIFTSPGRLSALSAGAVARAREFLLSNRVAQFYECAADSVSTGEIDHRAPRQRFHAEVTSRRPARWRFSARSKFR
jgi:glycosyltransferase involved in cell wall biosynthesis